MIVSKQGGMPDVKLGDSLDFFTDRFSLLLLPSSLDDPNQRRANYWGPRYSKAPSSTSALAYFRIGMNMETRWSAYRWFACAGPSLLSDFSLRFFFHNYKDSSDVFHTLFGQLCTLKASVVGAQHVPGNLRKTPLKHLRQSVFLKYL